MRRSKPGGARLFRAFIYQCDVSISFSPMAQACPQSASALGLKALRGVAVSIPRYRPSRGGRQRRGPPNPRHAVL